MGVIIKHCCVLLLLLSVNVSAGMYGSENWGEMYWGDNPVTAPTDSPTITSVAAWLWALNFLS